MFDDDARAEAERRYVNFMFTSRDHIEGFLAGAKWQASRTPVVPPGPCMAAMPMLRGDPSRVLCDLRAGHAGGHESGQASWSAAPVVADVDAIARVLGEHLPVAGIREGWCGAEGCEYRTVNRNGWTTHQAEQVAALLRGA